MQAKRIIPRDTTKQCHVCKVVLDHDHKTPPRWNRFSVHFRIGKDIGRAVGSRLCDVLVCEECGKKISKRLDVTFPFMLKEICKNAQQET